MSQLNGNGIPTNKTHGQVGDIYTDNNTNKKYKCVLAYDDGKDQYYQWISLVCGLGEVSGGIDLTVPQKLTDEQKKTLLNNVSLIDILRDKMTIRQALPEDVTNLDYFNKSGMYYGHNQDGHITAMPFNDGDFILLIYADERWDTKGQYFYNGDLCTQILIKCGQLGETEHIYVRATNFNEMGNMIHNDWTDLTSSSIMYIHVTSEEKDGETVFKSDRTYEEIKEAVDSGKSPVAICQDSLFFTLDENIPGGAYIFTNSVLGAIAIGIDPDNNTVAMCQGIPPYVTVTWSVNNMDIDVQIENDILTNLPTDINAYCQGCQDFGKNPAIELRVRKTNGINLSYDVFLYYTGNDFAGTTFINGNLTYCRLTMKNMLDTSTWDYTETEIPELYANMNNYISTDNIAEYNYVYKDENGTLYNERSVKYYDTMDKVNTNNTIYGNIAIVKSKGNSDIDIPYPVTVYSTSVNSHGNFDGWIVDACGNRYLCTIGCSKVTLGELMIHGIPQPSKNDANKVLCGDMTWKDAPNITDEHINTLINKKLGVIENGTY